MPRSQVLVRVVLVLAVACGCGEVANTNPDAPDTSADAAPDAPSTFTVGGSVSGFAGRGMVLQLNAGSDLTVAADGSFTFPTQLGSGAAYTVTVKSAPICPERTCTISNNTGAIASANVTDVTIACAVPKYRIVSQNWGSPQGIRVTDDLGAISNNATATPRILTGAATGIVDSEIDSVAFDGGRDLIYAAGSNGTNTGISVFTTASTASGNLAPARRILVTGETEYNGVEIDPVNDRLYVSGGSNKLHVFANASTLTGTVVPTASIQLTSTGAISLDRISDRLYVAQRAQGMYVFDNASQLVTSTTPSRTVTWTSNDSPRTIAIDGCRNRLYIGNRNVSPAGHNMYALDNAHTLTGAIDIEAAQARMTVPSNQVMSAVLDTQGALYFWKDSATNVQIINAPHSVTGSGAVTVDKVINAVVDRGYGLDVMAY